jgi:Domain of unknown function (DUF5618)
MSIKEREGKDREAMRYIKNAGSILREKAGKKDNRYQDDKYVRMACGTAYNGTLLALDTYLELKGKPVKKPKTGRVDVTDYRKSLSLVDKKLLSEFNTTYNILHVAGYYDGETKASVIRAGMESAIEIVNKIKPAGLEGLRIE